MYMLNTPGFSSIRNLFAICLVLLPTIGNADMRISNSVVYFYPDDPPRQDIEVTNTSNEPLYLKVEVEEVLNPGTTRQKMHRPANVEQMGFLASPGKAIVPPGNKRKVRLMNLLGPGEKERIYRVTFRPVPADDSAANSMVRLLVAYQSLVIVRPADINQEITSKRSAKSLLLKNQGNSNVLLQGGRMCTDAKNCTELPTRRLYPGNELKLALKNKKADINYTLNYGRAKLEKRVF